MHKRITGFVVFLLTLTMIFAQDWEVVKEQSHGFIPNNGFFLDANTGWLSGDDGEVWKTTDGGANWTIVRAADGSGLDWWDIEFLDADNGYATTDDGFIFKSTDGGTTWANIGDTANYTLDVIDIAPVTVDLVFFSCDDGQVLKWDGTTMTADTMDTSDDLDGGIDFIDANVGVVSTDANAGDTWYTHDGGATWNYVNIASLFPVGSSSYRLYDLQGTGDGVFVISGYHNLVFVSTDSGQTYTQYGDMNYGYVYLGRVDVIDDQTFIAGGGDGYVIKTVDGGATWDTLDVGHGETTTFVSFVDANNGFVFSSYGQWMSTTDGGANFTPLNAWPQVSFWGIGFPGEDNILLTGYSGGEITVSNDGGATWSYPTNALSGSYEAIYECEFIDDNTGIIAGVAGYLAKTTDGGATFVEKETPFTADGRTFNSVHYVDADTVYAGGYSGRINKSTDGGETWTEVGDFGSGSVYDICAVGGSKVVATASSGQYYYSDDYGTTFTAEDWGSVSHRAVEARNDVIIVPASSGHLYRTTLAEYDTLYEVFTDPDGDDLYDVEFVDDSLVYVVGEAGKIYKSEDAGLTWTAETSPGFDELQKVKYHNYKLWAVGQSGQILMLDLFPPYELPITEAFTDGDFDLEWQLSAATGDGSLAVVDSTGSSWGSHIGAFTDAGYTGIAHVKNAVFGDFTVSADVHIIGPADANAPLYAGIAFRSSHDEFAYYRFVYRNSSSSDNGQLKLQGYDGAAWHISAAWNPGVDFTALETGWHNFKVTVIGNDFYAYINDVVLPNCPVQDDSPFMTEGYPGIFGYNGSGCTILFDNFMVTEPISVVRVDEDPSLPETFALHQNYPNPFNPVTTIRFDLPQADHIRIDIYNILGKRVRTLVNEEVTAGRQQVMWDAKDDFGRQVASGMYLYRVSGERYNATKRMVLLK